MEVLASICPCPVSCGENGDGILTDCLCFGACCFPCPSISLLLAMFAMHHHSLSPSLPLPLSLYLYLLLPCLIISQRGWKRWMDIRLPARRNYGNPAAVIGVRCIELPLHHTNTPPSLSLFFFFFNSLVLSYSVSISLHCPPPILLLLLLYLRLHVIVCQPNLSNQQIRPK